MNLTRPTFSYARDSIVDVFKVKSKQWSQLLLSFCHNLLLTIEEPKRVKLASFGFPF